MACQIFSTFRYLILLMLLFSCSGGDSRMQEWMAPNGKLKVLTTIAMIDDLVKQVGGEHVDSITLIKGELDPHSYQLVKGDDEKFAFADLIFFNGLGLEHGPSLQNILATSKKAIGVGDVILAHSPQDILYDRGQLDPHIWMDVSLWSKAIPPIVEALSAKDPVHAELFKIQGQAAIEKMGQVHREIVADMQKIPKEKRYLVSSHDAFQYFVRAYLATEQERIDGTWHPRCASPEGLAPESQLSVAEIQSLIGHVARYHIHVLFPESNVSKDSIRKIVAAGSEKGLTLKMASHFLYADAMGPYSYLDMMRYDVRIIKENLNENG